MSLVWLLHAHSAPRSGYIFFRYDLLVERVIELLCTHHIRSPLPFPPFTSPDAYTADLNPHSRPHSQGRAMEWHGVLRATSTGAKMAAVRFMAHD
jgi:hypothetical protein